MDIKIENVRKKLLRGEKLSPNDLRSLEPLHDAIYDNDGRVVGVDGGATETNDDLVAGDFHLDYLDRSFLDGRHHRQRGQSSERLPRLVRYVGMVQDQLEPEYYESYDSRGRSRHFGDHYDLNSGNDNNNDDNDMKDSAEESKDCSGAYYSDCLVERIPLVVVPIPFASDWLFRGIHARSSGSEPEMPTAAPKSAVVSPVSAVRGERKRDRNDDNSDGDTSMNGDHNESSFVSDNSGTNQTRQKTSVGEGDETRENTSRAKEGEGSLSANATDWWPAGTCGTSMDECPVLAKMCYDELLSGEQNKESQMEVDNEGTVPGSTTRRKQRQSPLLLNDVVSLVGVLSMDPWDADFSGQQSSSIPTINGLEDTGWDSMMATTNTIPPPSRLPRLHVLSYRRIDLDGLAHRAINVEKKNFCKSRNNDDELLTEREVISGESRNSDSDSDDDSDVEWTGFPTEEKSIPSGVASLLQGSPSESLSSPNAQPWIRALWLCLLSEADRRRANTDIGGGNDNVTPKILRAGPAERALGCISLQLSTSDVASAKSLYRNLAENVLPGVCPVVAAVDLADKSATGTSGVSFLPRKDNDGRLKPCPLQLPMGSVLLIHCPPPTSNNENQNRNSKFSVERKDNSRDSVLAVLHELVQHHRIQYRFEGGVMIPFEADYRVIIVTTQTQDMPCTLSALTKTCSPTATPMEVSSTKGTCPTKPELREILVKGRSLNNAHDTLKFSTILLERAQQDFLERRRRCHESSASSALPGEDDFHRWLTMTKLQTKNRFARDERSDNSSNTVLVEEETGRAVDHSASTQYLEPSVDDWEAALQLDDDLRRMV